MALRSVTAASLSADEIDSVHFAGADVFSDEVGQSSSCALVDLVSQPAVTPMSQPQSETTAASGSDA